ncbi:alpha/beta-hydrolase [Meredithblackwellia eburnea MCA 4105]
MQPVHQALSARGTPGDAPYTASAATIKAALNCPNGIKKKAGGIVFLVHGTASTGSESWNLGPYVQKLPSAGSGYDVCWVTLPGRALGDAQLSAEYVAYGIQYYAPQSKTGKVTVIGHSQGAGLNVQWALTFWPSTRALVQQFISLAGDFKGTAEGALFCNGLTSSCAPSMWQQTMGSKYLAVQNNATAGGVALVPTSSIYTIYDDFIQPETAPLGPTSYLAGASVYSLQDTSFCGPTHLVEHVGMLTDTGAYGYTLAALAAGGPVALSKFDKNYCSGLKGSTLLDFLFDPSQLLTTVSTVVNTVLASVTSVSVPSEPTFQVSF